MNPYVFEGLKVFAMPADCANSPPLVATGAAQRTTSDDVARTVLAPFAARALAGQVRGHGSRGHHQIVRAAAPTPERDRFVLL